MKILITGGAGFIGHHLTKKIITQGHNVILVDNLMRAVVDQELEGLLQSDQVELHNLDLLDSNSYEKLADDFDIIFHLAAIIGVQHVLNRPFDVLDLNTKLLSNAIQFARKQKNLKRFVFTSTSEIYAGTLNKGNLEIPTPESSPLILNDLTENRTSYMLSKIYGEAMCIHSGLPYTIVRPHNFYGPRMGLSHVVPEICKKMYVDKLNPIEVFSPEHTRTFCYIDDAVKMMWSLATTENGLNDSFNIGNENPEVKIRDLVKTIQKVVDEDIKLVDGEETPGSPRRRCPSMAKTISATGFDPENSLEEGVSKTFQWYKENVFDNSGVSAL